MKKLLLLCLLPAILFGTDVEKNSVGQEAERLSTVLAVFSQRYEGSNTVFNYTVLHRTFNEDVYTSRFAELRDMQMQLSNFLAAAAPEYRRIRNDARYLLQSILLADSALTSILADYLAEQEAEDVGE